MIQDTKAYMRKWRAAHPEKCVEYHQKWKNKDRERYLAIKKRIYQRRKVAHIKACKLWNEANREKTRQYAANWRKRNPKQVIEMRKRNYVAAWRKKNPERALAISEKRRAAKKGAGVENCLEKIKVLRKRKFCHWCCTPLTNSNFHLDHVVPLSRGGHHKPDNLVASCKICNLSRGAKLVHEWTWKEAA